MDVALRPTRVLSICTGIGGLDLGVRLAVPGSRVVGYVERDSYSAAVIVARMGDEALDEAPIWDDVATFDGRRWRGAVDIVTAGFPCQPWSTAGSRAGTADPRWIWPDIARIIGEVGPEWVFLENVPGLVSGGGLAEVLGSLATLGFDAEWTSVWASEVGAPHRRERVFILGRRRGVADTRAERRERGSGVEGNGRLPSVGSEAGDPARHGDREVVDPPGDLRGTFGDGGREPLDGAGHRGASGESVLERKHPHLADPEGARPRKDVSGEIGRSSGPDVGRPGDSLADPGGLQRPVPSPGSAEGAGGEVVAGAGRGRHVDDARCLAGEDRLQRPLSGQPEDADLPSLPVVPGMDDTDGAGLQGRGDGPGGTDPDELGPRETGPPLWPPGPNDRDEWARILARWPDLAPATAEPSVRDMADGVSAGVGGPAPTSREGELRSLGNAVVPASAAHAFGILRARFEVED